MCLSPFSSPDNPNMQIENVPVPFFLDVRSGEYYTFFMPRISRIVLPGVPHHITHRGNRRQGIFCSDKDRKRYLYWLAKYSSEYKLDILAYCLMPNHIHIIGIPRTLDSIAQVMHIVNTRHTQSVNTEQGWSGHLFQGRYYSTPLDETHLWYGIRYVEQNPVRAGLCCHPVDYRWSSATYHCGIRKSAVVASETGFETALEGWFDILSEIPEAEIIDTIRHRTQTGIPCGNDEFLEKISIITGQDLQDRPRGRPRERK
jgi:putative transposase